MNDFNDGALLDHWEKTGDAQAFMELVTRYQGMVYGVCLRILHDPARAEELVQDCFLKLTHTRPKHVTTLGPWLHRVATNASIDSIRKDSRRTQRETEFSELQTSITENQWDDINEILDEELDSLPDPYREAIVAHFRKGHMHAEVANELNTHRSTITSRIKKGLGLLEHRLKSRGVVLSGAMLSSMMASEFSHATPPTLAHAMGKAVLSGSFKPGVATTPLLGKVVVGSIALIITALAMVAGFGTSDTQQNTSHLQKTLESTRLVATQSPSILEGELEDPRPNALEIPAPILEDKPLPTVTEKPTPPVQFTVTETPQDTGDLEKESTPLLAQSIATPTETVRLQCVNDFGEPIAGAQVYIHQIASFPLSPERPFAKRRGSTEGPLTSDEDGYIEFKKLQTNKDEQFQQLVYAVEKNKRIGLWQYISHIYTPTSPHPTTITMSESKTVSGKISIPKEFPMESVKINVISLIVSNPDFQMYIFYTPFRQDYSELNFSNKFLNVDVDDDGSFEIPNLPKYSRYYVVASAPGLTSQTIGVHENSGRDSNNPVDFFTFNLFPEGTIEGTVRLSESGKPLQGVTIRPFSKDNKHRFDRFPWTKTDENGYYRITNLPAGKYDLSLIDHEMLNTHLSPIKSNIDVLQGQATKNVNFDLKRSRTVSGVVLHKDTGKGIADVYVSSRAHDHPSHGSRSLVVTDENGKFRISIPDSKAQLSFSRLPKGLEFKKLNTDHIIPAEIQGEQLKPITIYLSGKEPEINYQEAPQGFVTGRVLDQENKPIPLALIKIKSKESEEKRNWEFKWYRIKTNKEGVFNIKLDTLREHQLIIGDYEWTIIKSEIFTVNSSSTTNLGDFYIQPFKDVPKDTEPLDADIHEETED